MPLTEAERKAPAKNFPCGESVFFSDAPITYMCTHTVSGRPTPKDDAERQFRNGSVRGLYKNYIESKAQMNSKEKQTTNYLTSRYLTEDFFEHITSKRSRKNKERHITMLQKKKPKKVAVKAFDLSIARK